MLTLQTNCQDCENLISLLCQINEKLKCMILDEYNNNTLLLGNKLNLSLYKDLVRYKRIFTNKKYYFQYVNKIDYKDLISRIKILLNK